VILQGFVNKGESNEKNEKRGEKKTRRKEKESVLTGNF